MKNILNCFRLLKFFSNNLFIIIILTYTLLKLKIIFNSTSVLLILEKNEKYVVFNYGENGELKKTGGSNYGENGEKMASPFPREKTGTGNNK